jgi:preprotein translocase subunit SecF
MLNKLKDIYANKYKPLLLITIVMLLFFGSVLVLHKMQTGEFVSKDVSLKGGLLITIHSDKELNINEIESALSTELGTSVSIKRLQGIGTTNIGYSLTLEPISSETALAAISKVTGLELAQGSYTVEEISSGLGATFWNNTLKAIGFAFAFMAIVVFLYFRKAVPSLAVILCAISNVSGTLAIMNLISMKLSVGGVAALVMLIGYSVDTDILLSTRMLRRTEGSISERALATVKTGMTMQLTAIAALAVMFFVSPAEILKQISLIIIIGLLLDIPNTWIQNAGIVRWYLERKHGKT